MTLRSLLPPRLRFWHSTYTYLLLCCLLGAGACSPIKYVPDGQALVRDTDVKFVGQHRPEDKGDVAYALAQIIKQKPNGDWFFVDRAWIYYVNSQPNDTTGFKRWVRRTIGEQPVVYEEERAIATTVAMTNYLGKQGYFNARVDYESDEYDPKKIRTKYLVDSGRRYYIDTLRYEAYRPELQAILDELKPRALLKKGSPMEATLYNQEVNRLIKGYRNRGYAYFTQKSFSALEADTSDFKADATLRVLQPEDSTLHDRYVIGGVRVFAPYYPTRTLSYSADTTLDGITFMSLGNLGIEMQTLLRSIYIRPGQTYQQDLVDKTNRQLQQLGIYKFVSIKYERNDSLARVLDFDIFLPPKDREEIGADLELSYSNASQQVSLGQSIGLSLSGSYRNRNLLRGAELFVVNAEVEPEFNIGGQIDELFNSFNLGLGTDLYVPRFIDPLNFYRFSHNAIMSDTFYNSLRERGTSRFSLGYNYLQIVNFYTYNSFNATFGYSLQTTPFKQYQLTQSGINYLNIFSEPAFDTLLAQNTFLERSFGDQLFTGVLFKDFTFTYSGPRTRNDNQWFGRAFFEQSGAEMYAINALFSPDDRFLLFNSVPFAQYVKLELEGRYTRYLSPKQSFAMRGITGLVQPFGYSEAVPYVKQFFTGGPNSIRAYRIRELGPGSYRDPLTLEEDITQPFFQTGNFILELNAEYRIKLFYPFEAAVFLDLGNIWLLEEDPERPGSGLDDFFNEIAIGTGAGVRLDFSYFIIRFDFGYPLRNPYPDANGNRWVIQDERDLALDRINFNLAIGYPF